jgi:hypothetical protein
MDAQHAYGLAPVSLHIYSLAQAAQHAYHLAWSALLDEYLLLEDGWIMLSESGAYMRRER